ncbi:MAG: type I-B CRISPR-associated protein Cas5b [Candidatus Poribacteria bacterium]|jgi:CRISPR-associated protein Cas5t|nr:type I-B CRISPR-associated protein Cas5b [Candidatus Poribacteria bacterium]MDP6751191.1 type I-B CRISPR-associated protein Cas5b [Candidatus Poribacteria bacterium]
MKVLRAEISGWTASFRHPLFVSGFQPTLPLPPLSTLYGLLSAAHGELVFPEQVPLGYVFQAAGKSVDLETVYEFGKPYLKAKSNVCRREFLVAPQLHLYTPVLELESDLRCPHFPLLLGRSTELATVVKMQVIELAAAAQVNYQNTLLPYPMDQVGGQILALPTHFTNTRPRQPQGIRPFCLVTEPTDYQGDGWIDPELGWGVFIHQ